MTYQSLQNGWPRQTVSCLSVIGESPGNRGEWLHCIQHARAVHKQCAADGVTCIVIQDQPEPKSHPAEFLVSHLLAPAP